MIYLFYGFSAILNLYIELTDLINILHCSNNSYREYISLYVKYKERVNELKTRIRMSSHDDVLINNREEAVEEWIHLNRYLYLQNKRKLNINSLVDATDYMKAWCPGVIKASRLTVSNTREPPSPVKHYYPPREKSTHFSVDKEYLVYFMGWKKKWKEWIPAKDIQPFGSKTYNPFKPLKTVKQWIFRKKNGQWNPEVIIPRNLEYKEKFLPITRTIAFLLTNKKYHLDD